MLIESLFCPCCTPALLHAFSQYGLQAIAQPLNLLGTGTLSATINLSRGLPSLAMSKQRRDRSFTDSAPNPGSPTPVSLIYCIRSGHAGDRNPTAHS